MTEYCMCSVESAQQYCSDVPYMSVFGSKSSAPGQMMIHAGWSSSAQTAALLRGVDKNTQLLLALVDPMFRKVTENEMSLYLTGLLDDISAWETFE